ncbi:GNAT family N-acetyltransferase [Epilithonimonas caeni]|uniref:GNAT family N-acetyltransferase n=1 Tax=Epilithonimonas caeni TaxID=365343 RepID=UPI00042845A7|nr:GNAT family N-acetyltransferase [Epilithonimonas caeni]
MRSNIRKATSEDLMQLSQLFDEYRMFYHKTSDLSGAQQFLSERLEKKDSEIFVAEDEGKLVGFVQLYPLFSSTRMKRYWLLNDLYVNSNSRGKGFSKVLIEQAKELCRTSNACGMYLETGKENLIGNQLYPSAGFKKYDEVNFYEWEVDN